MKRNYKTALASAVMAVLAAQATAPAFAHMEPKDNEKMEKCFGVVKAHKNDCASKANKHSCAGQAKHDADPNEWVKVPTGLCLKLSGGSLAPEDETKESKDEG